MGLRIAGCLLLAAVALAADSAPRAAPMKLTGTIAWPGFSPPLSIQGDPELELLSLEGTVPAAMIGPATVRNAFQVVHVSQSATVGRLEVRGLDAQVTDACVRGHADVVVIHEVHCTMTGGPQVGRVNIPFGLQVSGGSSVSVTNSSFQGFLWTGPSDRYWIGEGVTIESGVTGVQFESVTSNGNTDAGFDIKPFVVMDHVSAFDNCRNFRFWSGADVGTLTTGDSIKRGGISACSGIWLNGSTTDRPKLHIRKLIVRMKEPGMIIQVETGPADIEIDRCDIHAPLGTSMIRFEAGAGEVHLGPGCTLRTADAPDRKGHVARSNALS